MGKPFGGQLLWCMLHWCMVLLHQTLHYCPLPPPPSPHDSRLAGLGAQVGDRGGVEDESTFWEPSPPPAKGQYETKPKSQGAQKPCRLSKPNPTPRMTNSLVRKMAIGSLWGRSSSSGMSGWLIEHSLSRRRCSCVIPQRYLPQSSGRCRWTKYGRRQWSGPLL